MMRSMRTERVSLRPRLAGVLLAATVPSMAGAANRDIERLQIQVATLQTQASDLARMVEDLQKEVRRLNEALADQNATLRKGLQEQHAQQEAVLANLKDLGDRLGDVSERAQRPAVPTYPTEAPPVATAPGTATGAPATTGPGSPGPVPSTVMPPAGGPPPAPRELYSQAYADFARGNYDLAVQGFQEYLRNFPNTDFSDNAQYWIGECLYGKQRYAEAVDAWKALFRDYPSSDKLPDAHVKTGMALERLGRRSQALLEYRFVVDRYPNSQAARIARDKLNPN
jgi:tol-pal system protein YbgF